jgi:P2 family phage major capsid protein
MKSLSNFAYDRLSAYLEQVAEMNNINPGADPFITAARNFAVEPSIQQVLIDKQTEDTSLLGGMNKSEKLFLGLDGKVISSRTNVITTDRAPKSLWSLDDDQYECRDTHFDTFLSYAQIDYWAKFDDFEVRIGNHLSEAQKADRLKIGFNGVAHVPNTDRALNPLGQDVNVGWLERLRLNAPQQVMDEGAPGAGVVRFGSHATAHFKTLDAVVISATNAALPSWHINRTDLVALCSRDILDDKYFDGYNKIQPPSEQLANQAIDLQKRVGRYPAKIAPWFPNGTVAVTALSNLSVYEQSGSRRRKVEDNAKRSRFENYESFNEDYVIEDYEAMVMVENIEELDA